jgi:hypothetical protein
MTDACSKPPLKHEIEAHVWIGAYAIALLCVFVILSSRLEELGGMVGISGLASMKVDGEVATLREEVASLRHRLDAAAPPPAASRP